MQILAAVAESCEVLRALPRPVALVPMSLSLHEGHLACVRQARRESASVVVSMWLQGRPGDCPPDHVHASESPEADAAAACAAGADVLLRGAWYPPCRGLRLTVAGLAERWEGVRYPSMFPESTVAVLQLAQLVQPQRVYFGEKDYQQLLVMKRVLEEMLPHIAVVATPTQREADGLAVSVSNARLSPVDRERAAALHRAVAAAQALVAGGLLKTAALQRAMLRELTAAALLPDYAVVVDAETLVPIKQVEREARALVAAFAGGVRLIDNGPLAAPAAGGDS